MAQIFISYKRVNKDKVFSLVSKIENTLECKCWVDIEGIESSAQFASVICRAIDQADVVLFMHSSVHLSIDFENDWTIKELNYAQIKKKRVVLVKLDSAPLDNIFLMEYGSKNNIDSQDPAQVQKLMNDLRLWLNLPVSKAQLPSKPQQSSQPAREIVIDVTPEERRICEKFWRDVHKPDYLKGDRDRVQVYSLAQQGKTEAEYVYGYGLAHPYSTSSRSFSGLKNADPNRFKEVVCWLKKAADKGHIKALNLLTEIHCDIKEFDVAISYAKAAVDKSDYDAAVALYLIYKSDLHDYPAYIKALEKAAQLQINQKKRSTFNPAFEYGCELYEGKHISKDLSRAIKFLDAAIELDGTVHGSADALYYKAKALYEAGDKKAAIATLDKYKGDSFVGVTQKISQLRKEIVDSLPLYQRVFY